MKKYIIPTLLVINILATSYVAYASIKALQEVNNLIAVHDSVLVNIICTQNINGIIDLASCPK